MLKKYDHQIEQESQTSGYEFGRNGWSLWANTWVSSPSSGFQLLPSPASAVKGRPCLSNPHRQRKPDTEKGIAAGVVNSITSVLVTHGIALIPHLTQSEFKANDVVLPLSPLHT